MATVIQYPKFSLFQRICLKYPFFLSAAVRLQILTMGTRHFIMLAKLYALSILILVHYVRDLVATRYVIWLKEEQMTSNN